MRDAPSLDIVPLLQQAGATLRVYDPEGMQEAKKDISDVEWCKDAYDTMTGADSLAILTEWNEFRALDMARVKSTLKEPLVVDLRNIYDPQEMASRGIAYHCVGRPFVAVD